MDRRVPWIAAVAVFLIHFAGNPHYGYFRDELYFIICGSHPQWGYVDQPPIIPLLSAGTQLFGHSLFLLRAIPALFAAAGVYTTCLLVVELGGGVVAQAIAALTFFFTGVLMSFGTIVSPDSLGLFTWPFMALLVVWLVKGTCPRLWLAVGAIAGFSLESKYSVLFFLLALVVGLLLTPQRHILFNKWSAGGAALAFVVALPNFLWQWSNGFPMLELLRNGQNGKNLIVGPIEYLGQELIITGVVLSLVWIAGFIWLLRQSAFRYLAYAYIVLIIEMLAFHGKHYYPADIYPILIAAGGVAIERWTAAVRSARWVLTAVLVAVGVLELPTAMPVLPEQTYVTYEQTLERASHISRSATATEGNRETSALPGDWADMHGWPEMAATVASVYNALPDAERRQAVVFAGNYGEASAVAFFSPSIPVISEHNQYWLWGTHGYSGNVLVQVGGTCFHADKLFASRTLAATFKDPWAIDYENNLPIWVCRGIKKPLDQVWPAIKSYE